MAGAGALNAARVAFGACVCVCVCVRAQRSCARARAALPSCRRLTPPLPFPLYPPEPAAICVLLSVVMANRFTKTRKVMPAGLLAGASGLMAAGFVGAGL